MKNLIFFKPFQSSRIVQENNILAYEITILQNSTL